ncbi:hypothetical protein [Spirillospora sp. NPDC047279]|uniref:hypothetical protein n=1 Tax=Spirillospora sp. NPDC047279 TaxID=3155478 RepID=UPI0033FF0456
MAAILGGVQLAAMLDDPPDLPEPKSGFCPAQRNGTARAGTLYEETSAPYEGQGPHPVDVVPADSAVQRVELPRAWRPGADDAPPKAQLVACVYQNTAYGTNERQCLYSHLPSSLTYSLSDTSDLGAGAVKVTLLKTSYAVRVYQAKTARPVGSFDMPGAASCPARYKADSGGIIAQEPDPERLRVGLRPYVLK